MDFLFQTICNAFPHYIVGKNKMFKKIFYNIFVCLKFFYHVAFKINFKNYKFYSYPQKSEYSRYLLTRGEMPDPYEIDLLKCVASENNSNFLSSFHSVAFALIF